MNLENEMAEGEKLLAEMLENFDPSKKEILQKELKALEKKAHDAICDLYDWADKNRIAYMKWSDKDEDAFEVNPFTSEEEDRLMAIDFFDNIQNL